MASEQQPTQSSDNAVERGGAPYENILVIINPASGQDRPILGVMNRAFHEAGVNWDVRITKNAGDAQRFAQEAVAAGVSAVGVYGGDGTVMEVADGLQGSDVPLAIFPGGTANVMSVELGIPNDLAAATALVCGQDSYVRMVDVGRVQDKSFLLRVGIGFEAEVIQKTAREAKNRMGTLAYLLTGLQALNDHNMAHYKLTLDGQEVEVDGVSLMIANSGNMGISNVGFAQNIDVSDGLLDIVIIRDTDVGSLLQVAASAVGLSDPLPHWQARHIRVEAEPTLRVIRDGEPMDDTPVEATVLPQALRVIVPRAALSAAQADNADHTPRKSTTKP